MTKLTWKREDKILLWFLIICVVVIAGTLVLLAKAEANPFTCDDAANTCTYRVTASEPSVTKSGGALTNYKQTNIKTSLNGGPWTTLVIPATAAIGGGSVTKDVTFATRPCEKTTLDVKASGTNLLGMEGAELVATGSPVVRDRTLDPLCAPAALPGVKVD